MHACTIATAAIKLQDVTHQYAYLMINHPPISGIIIKYVVPSESTVISPTLSEVLVITAM